jgi:hypothetical protein
MPIRIKRLDKSPFDVTRKEYNEGGNYETGSFLCQLGCRRYRGVKAFLRKLGFTVFAGDQSQNCLIVDPNGNTILVDQHI